MRTAVGVGFVLLSALAYASTPALVTLSYGTQTTAVSLVALRCLAGAVGLSALAGRRERERLDRSTTGTLLLLGGLLFGPQMLLYFTALHYLDTSVTVTLVYSYPAMVVLLVALREGARPPANVLGLLVVATAGVVIASGLGPESYGTALGVFLALATAMLYAAFVVGAGAMVQSVPPLRAGAVVLLGAGVSSLGIGAVSGSLEWPNTPAGWNYIVIQGFVIVPVGMAAYYAGLYRLGPSRTSIVDTCQPAIAAAIGAVALGETLSNRQGVGVILILVAALGLPAASRRGNDGTRRRFLASR